MRVAASGFDWDSGNTAKCQKHGVSREEIENFFHCDISVAPSLKHLFNEDRYIAAGRTTTGRALFVAFTLRESEGRLLIRPISARYMHRKEIEAYEKKNP